MCGACGVSFDREQKEIARSKKLGRKFYCSNSCQAKFANNSKGNISNLRMGRELDEYSSFRYCMKNIRKRHKEHGFAEPDLDLKDLKDIWISQNGICPLTGWLLILPDAVNGWKTKTQISKRASVDRIISGEPYTKTNIRFISYMANLCRNEFLDEDVIEFCKAVSKQYT